MLLRELRRRFYRFAGPSCIICVLGYFSYHIFQGERGLIAWHKLENKIKESKHRMITLKSNHDHLEHRVSLLRSDNLCLDLLNEQSRKILGFVEPNEVMVLRKEDR
jgi:cell division protein FtsB